MIRRILVPVDGSKTSESILPHLEQLLKCVDVRLCLARVVALSTLAPDEQTYLEELKGRITDQFPDVESALLTGEPATELIGYAMAHQFDLIAMTTHGRSGLSKFVFGSVAESVLHQSPIPVFLGRPETKPARFRTILVPLDGSSRGARILPLVTELARASGAKTILFSAVPTPIPAGPASHTVLKAERLLRGQGIECEIVVRGGKPAERILEYARREPAELIAMTTHGRSGLARLRLGSVTEDTLRKSPVPMLVLRTAGAPRRELLLTARYYANMRRRLERSLKG